MIHNYFLRIRCSIVSYVQEMIIITGPVYAPVYVNGEWVFINRTIGTFPKLVHVPTHFYKLVVCYKRPPGGASNTKAPSSNTRGSAERSIVPYNGGAQQSQGAVDWWPAELSNTNKSVVAVAAFLVPNTGNVDAKVSIWYIINCLTFTCVISRLIFYKTPLAHTAVRIEQLEALCKYMCELMACFCTLEVQHGVVTVLYMM